MGELFSFSNPEFNRGENARPEATGDSQSNQFEETPAQDQAADSLPGFDFEGPESESNAEPASVPAPAVEPAAAEERIERRKRRRAIISAPVRVRGLDLTHGGGPSEILTTTNVSRLGVLFHTTNHSYRRGMELSVTFPYSSSSIAIQAEQRGRVKRVTELPDGRLAVAVAFGEGPEEDYVDASGERLEAEATQVELIAEPETKKPLVLAVDADPAIREMVKTYLSVEGYDVIAVSSNGEAREVLKMFTPALVIAEIEGEGLPGYDLCAHIKTTPDLKRIPVMLMTSSAYPSDYSSAHSLGAVVCIAKPFRQERFGHVVRLLAPLPHEKEQAAPARPGDPTRRHTKGNGYHGGNGHKNGHAGNQSGTRFQIRKRQ
jgi:CheY-like chemotaxis protein